MNKILSASIAFALCALPALAGETKAAPAAATTTAPAAAPAATPAKDALPLLTVDELAQKLADAQKNKTTLAIFDCNGDELRKSQGVIPTAVLLPSSSTFDLALLPKDKAAPVVFYCASDKCMASHGAAKRAIADGHTSVAVLSAGITGWVKAGKAVTKPAS